MDDPRKRAEVLERVREAGGLMPGVARAVADQTGVPEAHVYGAASFYHLLAEPTTRLRVCTGLSCRLAGSERLLEHARSAGIEARGCACLAACDRAPALLCDREVFGEAEPQLLERLAETVPAPATDERGAIGPIGAQRDPERLAIDLAEAPSYEGRAIEAARRLGASSVLEELERSGLQGRGGAGFEAARKWRAVCSQAERERYVICNADEGEPGTFKDREVLLRRPDRVLEGLVIAAEAIGARSIWIYLRGEFSAPKRSLERAIERFEASGLLEGLAIHIHEGDGAYICGEETALLEALEGKRGMPRLKPPYPTERGLWGKPSLIHNVETIACVPQIVERGGNWFRSLGHTEPGTKLYSISGHVERPGVYELPLGVSLDRLVEAAGGYRGRLLAFSPGGASSGFLPAAERTRPLDFGSLAKIGSMLGSAGVVVLNDTVDLKDAVLAELRFFEAESCGQCAPCRIGTRMLRTLWERALAQPGGPDQKALSHMREVAWEMQEGSICGLGQAAALPLLSVLERFGGTIGDAHGQRARG